MEALRPRRLFVAGATGATGKFLVPMARRNGLAVLPHARPATAAAGKAPDFAAVFELGDRAALENALRGCTTVVQLIGTMRARFSRGDTYETSDIGTTRQLVEASKAVGIDHFVLLSSVGAGKPFGAYLKAKAEAEALVVNSGIPYTIFRPSALEGGERKPIPGARAIIRWLGLKRFEPISLETLSAAMLKAATDRAPLNVALEGESLFALAPANP